MKRKHLLFLLLLQLSSAAFSQSFVLDSNHTYPSFEADHFGGVSIWRGKFTKSSGQGFIDIPRKAGEIKAVVDMNSVQIGNAVLDQELKSAKFFDTARYPVATYEGRFSSWNGDIPVAIHGVLTLHGISKPLTLSINTFKCYKNPIVKRDVCGAELMGAFNRNEFGIDFGKAYGFLMETKLHIQVAVIM